MCCLFSPSTFLSSFPANYLVQILSLQEGKGNDVIFLMVTEVTDFFARQLSGWFRVMTGRSRFRERSVTGKAGGSDDAEGLTGRKGRRFGGKGVRRELVQQSVDSTWRALCQGLLRGWRLCGAHKAHFEEHGLQLGSLFIFRLPDVTTSNLSLIQAYLCVSACSLL